jgi:hypothetical protein
MTTVLLIAVGLSIFFAVLKLADSIRDISFEIREARRTMERNAALAHDFQRECLQALKTRTDSQSAHTSLKAFLGEAPDQAGASELDRTDEFAQITG